MDVAESLSRKALMSWWRPALRPVESFVRDLAPSLPFLGRLADRFVPAANLEGALPIARSLIEAGMGVLLQDLDVLTLPTGPDGEYALHAIEAIDTLRSAHLAQGCAVTMQLPGLPGDAEDAALVCAAATAADVRVFWPLTAGEHSTLPEPDAARRGILVPLVPAAWLEAEEEVQNLLSQGVPRLGLTGTPHQLHGAWPTRHQTDLCWVRCAAALLDCHADVVLMTSDPRLLAIGADMAEQRHRDGASVEFLVPHGVLDREVVRLAENGHRVRILLPFGAERRHHTVDRIMHHEWLPEVVRR